MSADSLEIGKEWQMPCGLSLVSKLVKDVQTGVWRRSDLLSNNTGNMICVGRPVLTFGLVKDDYRLDLQTSRTCHEAQALEVEPDSEGFEIGSKGRTCQGYTPHFAVRSSAGSIIFDLIPVGDWRANLAQPPDGGLSIELDAYEDEMNIELRPGETFELSPGCLVSFQSKQQSIPAAHAVQSYVMDHLTKEHQRVLPVVYNTWFDCFSRVTWEGMAAQAEAAAKVGCEVFVVDAGWFGSRSRNWWTEVGDWRENPFVFPDKSFVEFADMVRSLGIDFGLWIEPERIRDEVPTVKEHPDWFIPSDQEAFCYPDIRKPEVREWVLSEMTRVVETYGAKWLKVDCNHDFSRDPYRLGHYERTRIWHEIVDELSERFPDLVVEGCASGGMRNDLLTNSHFHSHFLSDTVDPVEVLRIGMSTFCRLPTRMSTKWAVVYPSGGGWTPVGRDHGDTGDLVLSALLANGEIVLSYHLDFVMRVTMTGIMGISGNIAGLSDKMQSRLAGHIAFYKKHRKFIQSSTGLPLTPVESMFKRDGTAAIQLSDKSFDRCMWFAYNMGDPKQTHVAFKPVGLDPQAVYRVLDENGETLNSKITGARLLEGYEVECAPWRSRVIIPEKSS
jgi:alpha-galactosidase